MRPDELMIGDLVTFKDCQYDDKPTIVRIVQINANGDALVSIDGSEALDEISIDDEVVGIPLTPEILLKNGFKITTFGAYYEDDNCAIEICNPNVEIVNKSPQAKCTVVYGFNSAFVHRLKQNLSLCGIDKKIIL